jgi:Rieske 2Fe-2S family protein
MKMGSFYSPIETFDPLAKTLPGKYYTSSETYQVELERIFYENWLCAGRVEQIPNPGDYFLQAVGPESIIIVRAKDGRVHAFYNVCRHRGTRMFAEEKGKFSSCMQCPYHAWTYDLGGQLIGAPLMDELAGFDKADYPLHPVALVEWEGFLYVNLSCQPEPFERAFAPLLGKFASWNLSGLRVAAHIEYDVKANWKLIVQNYSECYHCPLIHPDLAHLSPYRSGRNDLFEGPFLGGFMDLRHEFGSMTVSGRACAAPIGSVAGDDIHRVYYYTLFPNVLLSLHPDYVMCHTLWPEGPGQTHIKCELMFDPQAMGQPGFDAADAVEFWDKTNRQDWHVCELSQLGVSSRAYTPSPYSGQESLLAAFDRQVLRMLGDLPGGVAG